MSLFTLRAGLGVVVLSGALVWGNVAGAQEKTCAQQMAFADSLVGEADKARSGLDAEVERILGGLRQEELSEFAFKVRIWNALTPAERRQAVTKFAPLRRWVEQGTKHAELLTQTRGYDASIVADQAALSQAMAASQPAIDAYLQAYDPREKWGWIKLYLGRLFSSKVRAEYDALVAAREALHGAFAEANAEQDRLRAGIRSFERSRRDLKEVESLVQAFASLQDDARAHPVFSGVEDASQQAQLSLLSLLSIAQASGQEQALKAIADAGNLKQIVVESTKKAEEDSAQKIEERLVQVLAGSGLSREQVGSRAEGIEENIPTGQIRYLREKAESLRDRNAKALADVRESIGSHKLTRRNARRGFRAAQARSVRAAALAEEQVKTVRLVNALQRLERAPQRAAAVSAPVGYQRSQSDDDFWLMYWLLMQPSPNMTVVQHIHMHPEQASDVFQNGELAPEALPHTPVDLPPVGEDFGGAAEGDFVPTAEGHLGVGAEGDFAPQTEGFDLPDSIIDADTGSLDLGHFDASDPAALSSPDFGLDSMPDLPSVDFGGSDFGGSDSGSLFDGGGVSDGGGSFDSGGGGFGD